MTRKVLVVDDDEAGCRMLRAALVPVIILTANDEVKMAVRDFVR